MLIDSQKLAWLTRASRVTGVFLMLLMAVTLAKWPSALKNEQSAKSQIVLQTPLAKEVHGSSPLDDLSRALQADQKIDAAWIVSLQSNFQRIQKQTSASASSQLLAQTPAVDPAERLADLLNGLLNTSEQLVNLPALMFSLSEISGTRRILQSSVYAVSPAPRQFSRTIRAWLEGGGANLQQDGLDWQLLLDQDAQWRQVIVKLRALEKRANQPASAQEARALEHLLGELYPSGIVEKMWNMDRAIREALSTRQKILKILPAAIAHQSTLRAQIAADEAKAINRVAPAPMPAPFADRFLFPFGASATPNVLLFLLGLLFLCGVLQWISSGKTHTASLEKISAVHVINQRLNEELVSASVQLGELQTALQKSNAKVSQLIDSPPVIDIETARDSFENAQHSITSGLDEANDMLEWVSTRLINIQIHFLNGMDEDKLADELSQVRLRLSEVQGKLNAHTPTSESNHHA